MRTLGRGGLARAFQTAHLSKFLHVPQLCRHKCTWPFVILSEHCHSGSVARVKLLSSRKDVSAVETNNPLFTKLVQ
jgi:hypothetical protein